jgi:hypothetical protein
VAFQREQWAEFNIKTSDKTDAASSVVMMLFCFQKKKREKKKNVIPFAGGQF